MKTIKYLSGFLSLVFIYFGQSRASIDEPVEFWFWNLGFAIFSIVFLFLKTDK